MEEPLFIDDSQVKKQATDFDYLRAEGVRLIQQLAGDSWTDYNEHDPGVTILEQFCYTFTELAYRTDFDIQDLLYDDRPEEKSRVLIQANELFPCNPLTVSDYRKLLLDSIFEIKNVWLFPMGKETSMNGLYRIALELQEEIKDEKSKKEVLKNVKNVFCLHRNIGEDIEQVSVLEPVGVSIKAEIEIDGKESLEAILANIFLLVDQHLSPEIKVYSLEELLEEGLELNEIFEGPYLKHGFIKTSELPLKASKILIPEITKIIMGVPGVAKVKDISLQIGDTVFKNQVDIEEGKLPRLMTDIPARGTELPIKFSRGSVQYRSVDPKQVKRILSELQAATTRIFRKEQDNIEPPKGKKLELEKYYSVQNHFP
ncbi:MAG: hypothetical protein O6939_11530, partial [Bacteroidetes bacterium]|nr:hypothetical protein [Bacteroidota bacterium]